MLITKENYTKMHNKQIAESGDKEENIKSSQKTKTNNDRGILIKNNRRQKTME